MYIVANKDLVDILYTEMSSITACHFSNSSIERLLFIFMRTNNNFNTKLNTKLWLFKVSFPEHPNSSIPVWYVSNSNAERRFVYLY